jgi:hypothetical protein
MVWGVDLTEEEVRVLNWNECDTFAIDEGTVPLLTGGKVLTE